VSRFNYDSDPLGDGGFGVVHAARRVDESGQMIEDGLAIKFLKDEWCQDSEAIARFRREVSLQQQELDHPHIMPILGRNLSANPPYFVMPCASHSLRAEIDDGLDENHARALEIFEKIASAIAHAHERDILHRDLKPENALFVKGEPCVSDFGLGKRLAPDATDLTRTEMWFGTERYMAPEQRSATKSVTPTADVYSLGKMLAELLTGNLPEPFIFRTDSVPKRYRYLLTRCCDQDPTRRYSDAGELLEAFQLLNTPPETVDPPLAGAEKLLRDWMTAKSSPAKVIPALHAHFNRYIDEEELYSRLVPKIPEKLLAAYLKDFPQEARELLSTYDRHIAGGLSFSYCDVVADFYEQVFGLTADVEIKRLVFERLWLLGPSHNRWHVGEVLTRMIQEPIDISDAMLAADVIKAHPGEISWHRERLRQHAIPKVVSDALGAVDTQRAG
jgi:serine/threonine protein kinase